MKTESIIKRNKIISWIPYLVFFAGSFTYFAFFGNYTFFYQEKSSLFIFSYDFLRENLHQPGGFLIWLGKFFSTFFYYPFAGATILSTILMLTMITVSKIVFILTGKVARIMPFIIGVSLFFLQADYHFLLFNILGFFLQLILFSMVIRYSAFIKGWLSVILIPLLFYFTGSFTWIFLLLMSFYFLLNKGKNGWIRTVALWSVSFLTFYISKEFLFFQPWKTLIIFPYSEKSTGLQQIIFFPVAGIISLLPLICKIRTWLPDKQIVSDFYANLIATIVLIIIIVLTGILRFDIKTKQYFYSEKLFYEDKFDDLIAYNISNPTNNSLTIFINNVALCETDKLNDLLFHFPQKSDGKTLFLRWEMESEVLNLGGYFYYTIGMINEAHRWAFENMVMKGHTPEGLKMLIKTDLINGNYKVASSYINILKKTLFYKNEAVAFEKLLGDTTLNSDNRLSEKRQKKISNDFFTITDNPFINVEAILATDSLNKKAFEYKTAFMLLRKDIKGIGRKLPEFEKLGFDRLPVHVEEAALALSVSNKGNLPDMGNLQISDNTVQRWNQYLSALKLYNNDVRSAEPTLKRRFGDTFWYYVFYK